MLPVDRMKVILQLENHFHYDLWLHHGYLLFDICGFIWFILWENGKKNYFMINIYFVMEIGTCKISTLYIYLALCCCSGCAKICNWHLPFCEIAPICVCNVTAPLTPILLFGALKICDPSAVRRTPGRTFARAIGVILFLGFRKFRKNKIGKIILNFNVL